MEMLFYTAGHSPALTHAIAFLKKAGIPFCDAPDLEATHLLLPVPSFEPGGNVKGGIPLEGILSLCSPNTTIIGGNLNHPGLEGYQTVDLLKDSFYVAENAAITAHCALGLILTGLPVTLPGQEALVIGYGRIGKCMAVLLKNLGATVTVAARKESDRAMAEALEFQSVAPDTWEPKKYRVIVNTAPAPVLASSECDPFALLLDLATSRGITGEGVNWARGLPGVCVPETSGKLIAITALRLILGKESTL